MVRTTTEAATEELAYDRVSYDLVDDGVEDGAAVTIEYESPYSGTVVEVDAVATDVGATCVTVELEDGRVWGVFGGSIRTTESSRRASGSVDAKNGRTVGYVESLTFTVEREVATDGGRDVAPEYEEDRVEADEDDLSYSRYSGLSFRDDSRRTDGGKTAIEFEYTTSHGNTKVVRAINPTSLSSFQTDKFPDTVDLESVEVFTFHDDGDGYAYSDDGRLWSYGDDHDYHLIGDVDAVYRVDLPEAAPVTGAVQEGVEVTVHYRSKRSGNLKQITLEDVSVDWEGDRVRGYHARRDRDVEVEAVYERSVVSKSYRGGDREVGKCARIDFPAGHSFDVDVRGLADDDVDTLPKNTELTTAEAIEEAVASRLGDTATDVDVTHDGRIDD